MTLFIFLLLLSALSIAGTAAYFSVKGIGILFAGAAISAMVMAGTLEVGKILSVSFLYRYWDKTNKLLKTYLITAILALMGITSLGIYGFLSSAYQTSSAEYGIYSQQITLLDTQKKYYQDEIDRSTKRIESLSATRESQENRLDKNNDALKETNRSSTQLRQMQNSTIELIKQTDSKIKEAQQQIAVNVEKIKELDLKIIEFKTSSKHSKDIVTFQFIAEAFNLPLNTVVKWFMLIIIVVFDPLAVCMILAYNVAVYGKVKRTIDMEDIVEISKPPIPIAKEVVVPANVVSVEKEPEKPIEKKKDESFFVQPKVMTNPNPIQEVLPKEKKEDPASIINEDIIEKVSEEPLKEVYKKYYTSDSDKRVVEQPPISQSKSPDEIYHNKISGKEELLKKNYFKLTEAERGKLTYDELNKMQDRDRDDEVYHVARTPNG